MKDFLKYLPCWLVGHQWTEWKHDDHYIPSAPAYIRTCNRLHRYDKKRKRWIFNVHIDKDFRFDELNRRTS